MPSTRSAAGTTSNLNSVMKASGGQKAAMVANQRLQRVRRLQMARTRSSWNGTITKVCDTRVRPPPSSASSALVPIGDLGVVVGWDAPGEMESDPGDLEGQRERDDRKDS